MLSEVEFQWTVDLSVQQIHLWIESHENWCFWKLKYLETGWIDSERY